MEYQNPEVFYLLIPLAGIVLYRLWNLFHSKLPFPRQEIKTDHLEPVPLWKSGWKGKIGIIRESFPYIRYIALFYIILAAAGPGKKKEFLPEEKHGIDIMFALDISGSMVKSRDFLPRTRLDVSKELLEEFILKRKMDRLGLVVFAGAAYLQAPLTGDLYALREILSEIGTETIEEQGTAIGDAILLATYRLKSSPTKTKIIILLTDGVSNTGKLDPETATETSRAFGIKVYTIGIGKDDAEFEVDFDSLTKISDRTGGQFFRAESPEELEEVLGTIDSLEKDILADKPKEIIETKFRNYLFIAIFLLFLDWGGRGFVFRFYP